MRQKFAKCRKKLKKHRLTKAQFWEFFRDVNDAEGADLALQLHEEARKLGYAFCKLLTCCVRHAFSETAVVVTHLAQHLRASLVPTPPSSCPFRCLCAISDAARLHAVRHFLSAPHLSGPREGAHQRLGTS
eukprot:6176654-Pleurochrysis_carterae.AAC.1